MSSESTQALARQWRQAELAVESARKALRRAETEALNAANALGKRLNPGDQKVGEAICCWVRFSSGHETLVSSHKTADASYSVELRGKERPDADGQL